MAIKNSLPRMQVPFMPSGDPAVDAAVTPTGMYSNVAKIRNLTPAQRKKRDRDALRNRVMVDLTSDLENVIGNLANQYQTSKSMIFNLLILLGLYYIEQSGFEIDGIKTASKSMRFEFLLNLPEIPDKFCHLIGDSENSPKVQNSGWERQR
jgi:hypothetical protein